MDNNLKEVLVRLDGLYEEWLLTPNKRNKSKIEDKVICIINNRLYIPDEIYIEANDGLATGLCQHGFFERDLRRLISAINNKLIY